jgi:WD40 repeat protein/Flp pilus assembly protein TadD
MNETSPSSPGDRPAIRVFISSTFRDMHAERDALNRLVFPELRRRCQARGAEFVGLDLRWGVTEDEIQREGTLAICLREVAQCRPFFVCLLGERFGSVYPPDEVPESFWDAVPREPALRPLVEQWYRRDDTVTPSVYRLRREASQPLHDVDATALVRYWEAQGLAGAGDSLTAHEIFRGVLEAAEPPAHALCYVRAPGLTDDPRFPPSFVPLFVETDEARRQKLVALRTRVRTAGDRLTVHDYDAGYAGLSIDAALRPADLSPADRRALDDGVVTPEEWADVSTPLRRALEQHGTVALTGMEAFATQVTDDLWGVIEPRLARPVVLDAHQRERAHHERFASRHAEYFQGRGPERERVRAYLETPDDREILVVTGAPGVGKSAFLAACVRDARARHPETLVIPHFIGAAPQSASLAATLRSLCETLQRAMPLEDAVAEDPDKLRVQLRAFLEQAGARRPIILMLDALNQLDPSGRSHGLDWLPLWAPPGTRIVVSTLSGDCLEQLAQRVPADHIITIPLLPEDERRTLITAVLARRRKQLTRDQLTALLDTRTRPDAALPLYTLVAVEELSLFGEYGALDARLASLPATLPELFAQVLARLEQDHTRPTVEAVCTWLAAARAGLLEAEVLDLLSKNGAFPPIRWTRLYRALEPYLKPIEEEPTDGATGRLDFHHDQLRLAVFHRYLQMAAPDAGPTDALRSTHRHLAEHFRAIAWDESLPTKWRTDRVRGLSELPFHQTRGEMWQDLYRTLTDFDFLEAKCAHVAVSTQGSDENVKRLYGGVFDLQEDYREAIAALPEMEQELQTESRRRLGVVRWSTSIAKYAGQWNDRRSSMRAGDTAIRAEPDLPRPVPSFRAESNTRARSVTRILLAAAMAAARKAAWSRIEPLLDHLIPVDRRRQAEPAGRIDILRAFAHFIRAECHDLIRFGGQRGFVLQQALNLAPDGPVFRAAAQAVTKNQGALFVRRRPRQSAYNPYPALSRTLQGHDAAVTSVAVAPDGMLAVSGGLDRMLRVWNCETGEPVRTLQGHHTGIVGVRITTDATRAVSVGSDGSLRVWQLTTGTCVRTLSIPRRGANSVRIAPDGRSASWFSYDNTLHVWELDNGECVRTIGSHSSVAQSLCVTPDGDHALGAGIDHSIWVWNLSAGGNGFQKTLAGHQGEILCVAMTSDGTQGFSGSADETVRVWNLETGSCLRTLIGHRGRVMSLSLDQRGRRLLSGSADGTARVWSTDTGECRGVLEGHEGAVLSLSLTGGRGVSGGADRTLRLWDTETCLCLSTLRGHIGAVTCLAMTPNGDRAISGSEDRTLRVWDLTTGTCLYTLEGHDEEIVSVAMTADGDRAISVSRGDTARVWDLRLGRCVRTIENHRPRTWPKHTEEPVSLAMTPDCRLALTGISHCRVTNVDLDEDRSWILHHPAYGGGVLSVSVAADGRRAVSGSDDNSLQLWDLESSRRLQTLRAEDARGEYRSVDVTPDGKIAVSGGSDHKLRVWDLQSGTCLRTLSWHKTRISALSVTPDGRMALSGAENGAVRLWDLATGETLHILQGHTASVSSVSLTPDGRRALTASSDGTMSVWSLETGKCLPDWQWRRLGVHEVRVAYDRMSALQPTYEAMLQLWHVETGECVRTIVLANDPVSCIRITADGRRAVTTGNNGALAVRDLVTGEVVRRLEGHQQQVMGLDLGRDGRRTVSGSVDGTLRLWDLDTGVCHQTLEGHTCSVLCVALATDGARAISGSEDRTLRVWDIATGQCLLRLQGHRGAVTTVAVSADGRQCVSGSADKTVRVWDLESGRCIRTFAGHRRALSAVSPVSASSRLVSGSVDGTLRVWDINTGQCLHTLKCRRRTLTLRTSGRRPAGVTHVSVTPNGMRLVSCSSDRMLRVWDLDSGRCLSSTNLAGGSLVISSMLDAVAVTPDGTLAVTAMYAKTCRLIDLEADRSSDSPTRVHGTEVAALRITADGRRAVSAGAGAIGRPADLCRWNLDRMEFAPFQEERRTWLIHATPETLGMTRDGRLVAFRDIPLAGSKASIWILDLETGAVVRTVEARGAQIDCLCLGPDGRTLVSAGADHALSVWDVRTGNCLHILSGHTATVRDVRVTPDGRRAISASADKTLRIWDLLDGECLQTLEGHADAVNTVRLSPDARYAVSSGSDSTLRVWDIDTGSCVATLPEHGHCLGVTVDGHDAVLADDDGVIRLRSLATGGTEALLSGPSWETLDVAAACNRLVAGSYGGEVEAFDIWGMGASGGIVAPRQQTGHSQPRSGTQERVRCSFCFRSHERVQFLIAGRSAHVCDECATAFDAIFQQEPVGSTDCVRRWTIAAAENAPCSFCNESRVTVPDTIEETARICDGCVSVCLDILNERLGRRRTCAKVCDARWRLLGKTHTGTLAAVSDLAGAIESDGDYAKAEAYRRHVLALKEEDTGRNPLEIASSAHLLAVNLRRQGKHMESEARSRRALQMFEEAAGPDHPDTANALSELVASLCDRGEFIMAEPLQRRYLTFLERALGPNDDRTAMSAKNLIYILQRVADQDEASGSYDDALFHRNELLQMVTERMGPAHPELALALNQSAVLFRKLGRAADAEVLLRRAIAIERTALPDDSPKHPHRLNNLCVVLVMQGKLPEAKSLCAEAWSRKRGRHDVTSARILFVRLAIALLEKEPIAPYVGRLKMLVGTALDTEGDVSPRWDMDAFFDCLRPKMSVREVEFLKAVVAAMNDPATVADLDVFVEWRDTSLAPADDDRLKL